MPELITNLTWIIIGTIVGTTVGLVVVYSLVRLAAIAWHRTKAEYYALLYEDEEHPEPKRQNDEEL
ncbi:hypothetical protein LCGC14_2253890 [marine sediment metagenome]|uniref:Uncharacterized protein n=1 Tax=marine sediment metagenome TaxID=412755 RepID=A0A0F9FE81_9ZZZZ